MSNCMDSSGSMMAQERLRYSWRFALPSEVKSSEWLKDGSNTQSARWRGELSLFEFRAALGTEGGLCKWILALESGAA